MSWLLANVILVTILSVIVALLLILLIHYTLRSKFKEQFWATVVADGAVAIMMGAIVAPAITNAWAMRRDLENRRREAQDEHLERLRPVLRADAKQFAEMALRISRDGHAAGNEQQDFAKHLDTLWYTNILSTDLGAHFQNFAVARDQLRESVLAQDREIRELVTRIVGELGLAESPDSMGTPEGVAYALVRQCMNTGTAISLEVDSGRYSYKNGLGQGVGGEGEPPRHLIAAEKTFREFVRTGEFKSSCERFRERIRSLPDQLLMLSQEATSLAELAAIRGVCEYTRIE